jgi:anion-transporting  ArsA/GET3 family ATPase
VTRRPLRDPLPPRAPRVVICAGGGGVGKTTTSAALGLALAQRGHATLLVTIDPARRLAGALGVPITDAVTPVTLPAAGGKLSALMPDPRRSLRTFIEQLFADEPEARDRVLANRLYVGLSDATAGVHELVAMNLVAHASASQAFDFVVIDTAPSRHAIDFVTYPGRLAALLGGRTVAWLANLAARAGETDPAATPRSGGVLSWGAGHLEGVLARVTGPTLVRDTASLFGDLATVRGRFVSLTERAAALLLGERATYVLVAAPTAAARDDVRYLAKRLDALGRAPHALLVNRADTHPAPHLRRLRDAADAPAPVRDAAAQLLQESASRTDAADALCTDLAQRLPRAVQVRLPHLEAPTPDAIVRGLCDALAPHLDALLPGLAR